VPGNAEFMSNLTDVYPLSPMQQGILFESLNNEGGLYVEQLHCEFVGELDVGAFVAAWESTVQRHSILRSAFVWEGIPRPAQAVRAHVGLSFLHKDWSELASDNVPQQLESFLQQDRNRGFDLRRAPLMRLSLLQVKKQLYQFIWTYHHSILDGWSEALVLSEVMAAYKSIAAGQKPVALPERTPFRDYVAWIEQQDRRSAEEFWKRTFDDCSLSLSAFDCRNRVNGNSRREHEIALTTPPSTLQAFLREHSITLNTLVLGAWALLLGRYRTGTDVVIGLVVSGRPPVWAGGAEAVGMFVNTLPVRVRPSQQQSVVAWLHQLQEQQLEVQRYQFTSLTDIHRWLQIPAGQSLVECIFAAESYPVDATLLHGTSDLKIRNFKREMTRTNSLLTLSLIPEKDTLIRASSDANRFPEPVAERLPRELAKLITRMTTAPNESVANLCRLDEEQELHFSALAEHAEIPSWFVQDLVAEQSERTPDTCAVISAGRLFLYREMEKLARSLAFRLQQKGVGSESVVGLLLPRSAEMIIAILGVLKSGAAYLPLDPGTPRERILFILKDAGARAVVCSGEWLDYIRALGIDALPPVQESMQQEDEKFIAPSCSGDKLAYVIYTSGSSGEPKGVLVEHRNLAFSTDARFRFYDDAPGTFLLVSPFTFDSSVAGIFWTLCRGGTLVVPSDDDLRDASRIAALLTSHCITHLLCTPSFYLFLLETLDRTALQSLRIVIVAGEVCTPRLVEYHYRCLPRSVLFNEYGPTEATVWSSVHHCQPGFDAPAVPIGKPIPGARMHILDADQHPVPPGAIGELYVGGPGVARGYLNRAQLTAYRFIADPFFPHAEDCLYRTGDLARQLPDGSFEFRGRQDDQIKMRGYRIEPAEIERALEQHPSIDEAVVVLKEDLEHKQLIACLRSRDEVSFQIRDLEDFLRSKLPAYMVPSRCFVMDSFPLTQTGKIDRHALVERAIQAAKNEASHGIPGTDAEEKLALIWRTVLKASDIGTHDNFFELGGDSILTLQVVWRARESGLRLTPQQIFENPTIAQLARVSAIGPVEEDLDISGRVLLTPIQHWFFEQQLTAPHHFNQAFCLEIKREIDKDLLQSAFARLTSHHDALRTRFHLENGQWEQSIVPKENNEIFSVVDLSHRDPTTREEFFHDAVAEAQGSLDFSKGPLFRGILFHYGSGIPDRLLIVAHHLVVDGISWRILLEDLESLCLQAKHRKSEPLPPKTSSYRRWARALTNYVQSPEVHEDLTYWTALEWQRVPSLPVDASEEDNSVASEQELAVSLTPDETSALISRLTTVLHATVEEAILSAFAGALSNWTGSRAVLFDCEGHGRDSRLASVDVSRTVGWFTNVFPVLLQLPASQSPVATLTSIKEQFRKSHEQRLRYGLLRYLKSRESRETLCNLPQAEVGFNYFGQLEFAGDSQLFRVFFLSPGNDRSSRNRRKWLLETNAWTVEGRLHLSVRFSSHRHQSTTMQQVANHTIETLRLLAREGDAPGSLSPSDFPLLKMSRRQLSGVIAKAGKN
jgi:amino acid adenylation domain-containing protein/non-ribosomal peptide synthase protein (TIGR01720 family)